MASATLSGLRVVEFAARISGPLAGTLLADHGADVIHIEDPGDGDALRHEGPTKDGTNLWWKVAGRNKRSVTIDLRREEGQKLARQLAAWADVVITNVRVGTLERWQLDFANLQLVNPTLIMLHISALGASGPTRDVAGFGKIGEARSGVAHLSGLAGNAPVFSGYLLSDAVTGALGALAIQMALYRRAHDPDFAGEWIDDALTEALFRLVDWQVVVHDQLGVVPERIGNDIWIEYPMMTRVVKTYDQSWLLVTASSIDEFQALARLVGDSLETSWDMVVPSRSRLDAAVDAWAGGQWTSACLAALAEAGVVACKIFNVVDIFADAVYAERNDIIEVTDRYLGKVRMQSVVPRFVNYPGNVWRCGPSLGEDNQIVLQERLGLSEQDISELELSGIVGERGSVT